jgi:hypothetical protein
MLAIATSPTIFASKKGFKRLSKKIKKDGLFLRMTHHRIIRDFVYGSRKP